MYEEYFYFLHATKMKTQLQTKNSVHRLFSIILFVVIAIGRLWYSMFSSSDVDESTGWFGTQSYDGDMAAGEDAETRDWIMNTAELENRSDTQNPIDETTNFQEEFSNNEDEIASADASLIDVNPQLHDSWWDSFDRWDMAHTLNHHAPTWVVGWWNVNTCMDGSPRKNPWDACNQWWIVGTRWSFGCICIPNTWSGCEVRSFSNLYCDDNNPDTANDMYTVDGCECIGLFGQWGWAGMWSQCTNAATCEWRSVHLGHSIPEMTPFQIWNKTTNTYIAQWVYDPTTNSPNMVNGSWWSNTPSCGDEIEVKLYWRMIAVRSMITTMPCECEDDAIPPVCGEPWYNAWPNKCNYKNDAMDDDFCAPGYGASCEYCKPDCTIGTITGDVCGDGKINWSETCDNGSLNGKACTATYGSSCEYCSNTCKKVEIDWAVCGDGKKDTQEQCDAWSSNGRACTPWYGSTCTYCTSTCQNKTVNGPVCGDGKKDTQEQCDKWSQNGVVCTASAWSECTYCDNSCQNVIVSEVCETLNCSTVTNATCPANQRQQIDGVWYNSNNCKISCGESVCVCENTGQAPKLVGSSCDDNNANTENDIILADGCSCQGTQIDPKECLPYSCPEPTCPQWDRLVMWDMWVDDNDCETCREFSCEPILCGEADYQWSDAPGNACDDNNPDTKNDIYNKNCICEWELIVCSDPEFDHAAAAQTCTSFQEYNQESCTCFDIFVVDPPRECSSPSCSRPSCIAWEKVVYSSESLDDDGCPTCPNYTCEPMLCGDPEFNHTTATQTCTDTQTYNQTTCQCESICRSTDSCPQLGMVECGEWLKVSWWRQTEYDANWCVERCPSQDYCECNDTGELPKAIWTTCDDNNLNTIDDKIQANGCSCEGIEIAIECPIPLCNVQPCQPGEKLRQWERWVDQNWCPTCAASICEPITCEDPEYDHTSAAQTCTNNEIYNDDTCTCEPKPVDCMVSKREIGACSGSTRVDTRTITVQPANGGSTCPELTREEVCTPDIDCEVSERKQGVCMENNTMTSTRMILTDPVGNGAKCPELSMVGTCVHTAPEYDLALTKSLKSGQSRIVEAGDRVTFVITVTNQGTVTASSFVIEDNLPSWLTLDDDDWMSIAWNNAEITVDEALDAGDSIDVDITVMVGDINGTLINVAQISSDDGEDIDSKPNNNDGDQSEDDEDEAEIVVLQTSNQETCNGRDDDNDGNVDEGFESMAEWRACDDNNSNTINDVYNDMCVCAWELRRPKRSGWWGWWVSTLVNYCGDGIARNGEQCDDGNNIDGDGCSRYCKTTGGVAKPIEPAAVCGNSVIEDWESCDDGNTTNGDGCSDLCLIEVVITPVEAQVVCGDGLLHTTEQCDDGNTINWDWCNASCRDEVEETVIDAIMEKKKAIPTFNPLPLPQVAPPAALPATWWFTFIANIYHSVIELVRELFGVK